MNISLSDFLKLYPNCPLCNDKLENKIIPKERSIIENYKYLRCKNGHYEIAPESSVDDTIVYISFTTDYYDISIYIIDDWIRIEYGILNKKEITFDCKDFAKWMLPHDQMLIKLNKLWSLA